MRITSTRLSDGRELRYYDEDSLPERIAADERGLEPGSTQQGRMRFDALTGEWIAIAGHRQSRIFLPSAAECPLCPSSPGNLSEIPESSYRVAVFENRFPSFQAGGSEIPETDRVPAWGEDLPAYGRCEVVAFSDDHTGSIASLDPAHMSLVMDAWIDRTRVLGELPGVRYVFVFENRGAEIGVTLHHPHGQIYAYPYVPPWARGVLVQAARAERDGRPPLLANLVEVERAAAERIVWQDEHWIAFVPYAARWPFEVQIHPVADRGSLTELTAEERESFCGFYPRLVRALDSLFGAPLPYMSGWFQRPAHATEAEARDSRLFLRLVSNRRAADKLKVPAGSETLMGAFISDVPPEQAAERIRAALELTP